MSQMFSARGQHNDPQPTQRRRRADLPVRDYLRGDASAAGADMSAPERIWATGNATSGSWNDRRLTNARIDYDETLYIRADLAPQWQPIATAPKDGTVVDLWCKRTHCHGEVKHVRKCNASWVRMADQFSGAEFYGWSGIGETYADNTPLFWTPLPTPPEPAT